MTTDRQQILFGRRHARAEQAPLEVAAFKIRDGARFSSFHFARLPIVEVRISAATRAADPGTSTISILFASTRSSKAGVRGAMKWAASARTGHVVTKAP